MCRNIRQTAEALNNLKLNYMEWAQATQNEKADNRRMSPPSFDIVSWMEKGNVENIQK